MSSNRKVKVVTVKEDLLINLRQNILHKHPEVSGQEKDTARKIAGFLSSYNPTRLITDLGGHGVAAVFQKYDNGPTILIRCELDALPITEESELSYKSQNEGVAHVCGHDGHMTIVAGLAPMLSENRPEKGRVVLLFQPAEENGEGANAILADPKFEEIKPDYVFALHNLPGYPLNKVVLRKGNFTSAVTSMIFKLKGKTSHAGEPEMGINPALALAEMIQEFDKHMHNEPDSKEFSVITPVHITMGEKAYGVSAGECEYHITVRCWTKKALDSLCQTLESEAGKIADNHGIKLELDFTQEFAPNRNNEEAVQWVRLAAEGLGLNLEEREFPFKWGEDFGQFTQQFGGAMFGLGAGEDTPALHNPDYDFPDALINTGSQLFFSIIQRVLNDA